MESEKKKRRLFGGGRRKRMQDSKSVRGSGDNLCSCGQESCSCCTGETVFTFDKLRLLRIAAAIVLFIVGLIVKAPWALELIMFFAAFVIVGYDAVIEGVTDLTLDLAGLDYISSAGLRVFLTLTKRMHDQGTMKIINTGTEVMEIFKVTGFEKLLNIV